MYDRLMTYFIFYLYKYMCIRNGEMVIYEYMNGDM